MQSAEPRKREVWQSRAILHSAFYTLHLEWWEVLVMLQFVASDTYFVTPDLQSSSRNTSQIGSGGRNYTCLKRFMRPSSVL